MGVHVFWNSLWREDIVNINDFWRCQKFLVYLFACWFICLWEGCTLVPNYRWVHHWWASMEKQRDPCHVDQEAKRRECWTMIGLASSFFLFYSAWVPSLWDVASQIWSGSSPHNTLTSQSRWGMRVTRMHSICNHRIIQDNSVNKVVFSFHVQCPLSTHNSFFTLSSHLFGRLV